MNDEPLGFGVTARSTAEAKKLEPTGIVVFRQADAGEYLREVRAALISHAVILICSKQLLTTNRRIPCSLLKLDRSTNRILHVYPGILDLGNLDLELLESLFFCEKYLTCLKLEDYTLAPLEHIMNIILHPVLPVSELMFSLPELLPLPWLACFPSSI